MAHVRRIGQDEIVILFARGRFLSREIRLNDIQALLAPQGLRYLREPGIEFYAAGARDPVRGKRLTKRRIKRAGAERRVEETDALAALLPQLASIGSDLD